MLPEDTSVHDQYFRLLDGIGGNLASILNISISLALNPANTEAQFEDWYGLIAMFLDQNKFQISDKNKWDHLRDHPYFEVMQRVEQDIRDKYPYLHFRYGLSGGERAFDEIITYHPDASLDRRLKLLKLMVKYWPNHRYASDQRDGVRREYIHGYFFQAYFLGPEFMAVLDPTGDFYNDEWFEYSKKDREEHQAYLDKIAARRADATQNTPEATTKTV